MSFLPKDYESPKSSTGYMKIQDGENRIRILSAAILGWEDWKDKKPIRYRMMNKPDKSIDPEKPLRHFWAMIVWDYSEQKIKILEITQASIRKRIEALSRDSDWGSPYTYDIKIVKTGQKVDTEYTINPVSHKELDPGIKAAFLELPIDLEELFRNGDPYAGSGRSLGFWELPSHTAVEEPNLELITKDQVAIIESNIAKHIHPLDPHWRQASLKALKITSFERLEKRLFDLMMKRLEDKKDKLASEDIPF